MSDFVKSRLFKETAESKKPAARDFREVDFAKEARSVLDEAITRGAEIERRAYEEGFAKGEKAGVELGKQQMMPVLERLEEMLREIAGAREGMLLAMEKKIVTLSIDIAERIIHKAVAEDEGIVKDTVWEVLALSVDRGRITLRVSPAELQVVQELSPEILKIKGVEEVDVTADEAVPSGGCILETSGGTMDARLETGLNEVRTLLG